MDLLVVVLLRLPSMAVSVDVVTIVLPCIGFMDSPL